MAMLTSKEKLALSKIIQHLKIAYGSELVD
jgi:hypothetical protein